MDTVRQRALDLLTPEEIKALTRRSDAAGFAAVATTWLLIAGALVLAAVWPHPLSVLAALLVLGGRHLALAVLAHETAHGSLFRSRRLGDWIGRWLCAAPGFNIVEDYRRHHLKHHLHTGTARDPDLSLIEPFPTSRASLARKFARDLVGIAGLRRAGAIVLMGIGVLEYTVAATSSRAPPMPARARLGLAARRLGPGLVFNGALAGSLAALGHVELFALWVGSYLTTYSAVLRLRSIAEHACTSQGPDPIASTRTVHAGLLARLLVAPHRVNYHVEHHVLMGAPYFQLPRLHALLHRRGVLADGHLAPGYGAVLRAAAAATLPA